MRATSLRHAIVNVLRSIWTKRLKRLMPPSELSSAIKVRDQLISTILACHSTAADPGSGSPRGLVQKMFATKGHKGHKDWKGLKDGFATNDGFGTFFMFRSS